MSSQPEGRVSRKIINEIKKRGGYAWKVHGNEYQPAGTPDISIVWKGYSFWCETKMPGNEPSMIQLKRHNDLRRAGALVVVAYSLQDVLQMLEHSDSGDHTGVDCGCLYITLNDLEAIQAERESRKRAR